MTAAEVSSDIDDIDMGVSDFPDGRRVQTTCVWVWADCLGSCNLRTKMIPYEELERALGRWKARRGGTSEISESTAIGRTPAPVVIPAAAFQDRESSGEFDLGDAVLDEN